MFVVAFAFFPWGLLVAIAGMVVIAYLAATAILGRR
jgi:hypothetical protein